MSVWDDVCFIGHCLCLVMRKFWRRMFAVAVAALLAGCANWMARSDDIEVFCGRERGTPYLLAPYPYCCTATVFRRAVCAPFRAFTNNSGPDGIADAIYTITWPAWVVDDACEAVLDTVFLPADAVWYLMEERK